MRRYIGHRPERQNQKIVGVNRVAEDCPAELMCPSAAPRIGVVVTATVPVRFQRGRQSARQKPRMAQLRQGSESPAIAVLKHRKDPPARRNFCLGQSISVMQRSGNRLFNDDVFALRQSL